MFESLPTEPEDCPQGIEPQVAEDRALHTFGSLVGKYFSSSKVRHENTFDVTPLHQVLKDGVKFNVESVPRPTRQDGKKKHIGTSDCHKSLQEEAERFYFQGRDGFSRGAHDSTQNVRIEAVSSMPNNLVYAGGSGFFAACLAAFAQHLPLALSPDHIWTCISYAFARHVQENAEELRHHFVQHQGKKRLEIRADNLVMSGGDIDNASPPQVWEDAVFHEFSNQIKEHVGDKVHGTIVPEFSTSTPTARTSHEIGLMQAMKHYFSYGMITACGIPNVTLLGTEQDWIELRKKAQDLSKFMVPSFAKLWMPALLPVLDEFVSSYQGDVNHGFWQSMVKVRRIGQSSGGDVCITGWIQILFPYLHSNGLRPWQEMYFRRSLPSEFPPIISSAPVDWTYYGAVHDLHLHAGFVGCNQDPSDGTLTPALGWYVTHDPPKDPKLRLEQVAKEMQDLRIGHEHDQTDDFKRRMIVLQAEERVLKLAIERMEQKEKKREKREREWKERVASCGGDENQAFGTMLSSLFQRK